MRNLVNVRINKSNSKAVVEGNISEYMKMVDPFLFKTGDDRIVPFQSLRALYAYTIRLCRERSKGGWLDLVLLLAEHTFLSYNDAVVFVQCSGFHLRDGVSILIWEGSEQNAEYKLEQVMKLLHSLTGTPFDSESYRKAWEEIDG